MNSNVIVPEIFRYFLFVSSLFSLALVAFGADGCKNYCCCLKFPMAMEAIEWGLCLE